MNQCRSCNDQQLDFVMHLDRVPEDVQRLVTIEQLGQKNTTTFDLYQCTKCGLVQAPFGLKNNYYDDYLMSTTFSSQLTTYLDMLVDEFTERYQLQHAHVVDVGCGDGAFMLPFVKRNIRVTGVEPSDRSRSAAKDRGLNVYPGYVSADTKIPGAPYSAFVTRQVLEHVPDITGFLNGILNNLTPDAVGIIEVPRLEKALEDRRFYDFFPDHVNYFTLNSLRTTLEIHGFEVLDLRATMHDEYNVAVVRRRKSYDFTTTILQRKHLVEEIENVFNSAQSTDQRTAIWGAGAKGLSIMTLMNKQCIDLVVDSDPNKLKRYIPATGHQIQDTHELIAQNISVLVVSAVAYQQVILQKLRNMNFQGQVYLINHQGLDLQTL